MNTWHTFEGPLSHTVEPILKLKKSTGPPRARILSPRQARQLYTYQMILAFVFFFLYSFHIYEAIGSMSAYCLYCITCDRDKLLSIAAHIQQLAVLRVSLYCKYLYGVCQTFPFFCNVIRIRNFCVRVDSSILLTDTYSTR